ncbi:MAG TPA: PQQ-binding-like beta-propeller repeat protein, partial [Planctomycetaceae bacterium]|nr:PQQ-binding-like beta-propeller repeat protein [Planctomycetaceae bacterium]
MAGDSSDAPPAAPLSIDRSLQQPLSTARSLIAHGQFAEAIRSLQPVLGVPQNTLVFLDRRYIDAKVAANRLIASLPAEARTLYEREFGGLARRELERAQAAGRIDQILLVASTYRHTEAGRQALAAAAGLFFDGGQFLEAAATARELLETPGAAQESAAAARLVTAWLKLGQVDAAQRWVEMRRKSLSHHDIEIQGAKHRLDQWLLECIRQQAAGAARGGPVISGGHSQTVGAGRFERPSARTIWNKRFEVSGVVASLAQELIARRVESGIPPVFHPVPLVVGQTLVARRNDELAAYDLHGGPARWTVDLSPSGGSSLDSETLADRAFAGGPQCALSTDGERVFTVVEDAATYVRPVFTGRGRRIPVELPPKNSLSAYDLRGGKRLWHLAEIEPLVPSSRAEHGDRDVDFLGPPLACGGTLYVMGRTNEGANLLALDPADGTVRWGRSLAGFSGFETDVAPSFGPACIPAQRDGLLLCPTSEGIVIAVDLATRTCRWAFRAQPTEEPSRLPPRWGRRFPAVEARWLNAWRESVVRLDEGRCFFVSPRSAAIHALEINSGKVLWTQPVANGLFLGPIVDGRLLAFSQYRALAFDVATGTLSWRSAIGLPSGRGFTVQGRYLLPQSAGGLAALDVHTGAVEFPLPQPSTPLGNLVPLADVTDGVAISQSHDQLALLVSLDRLRAEAAEKLRLHPGDRETLRRVAQLDREAGDFESAERLYADLLKSDAHDEPIALAPSRVQTTRKVTPPQPEPKRPAAPDKPPTQLFLAEEDVQDKLFGADHRELFETLVADIERNPKRCPLRAAQLLSTAAGDEQRAVALRTVGTALASDGERMLGLKALLELARLELPGPIEVERGPRRAVAFERQLGADLQELLRACPPPERRQADAQIEQALKRAI